MDGLKLAGLTGGTRSIDVEKFEEFVQGLAGTVVFPDQPDFGEAVSIWNAMIEKRPGLVVRAQNADDVVRVVNFVRENDIELAIKGGGHNIAGLCLSDGGIMLDMSSLRKVEVDPSAKTVTAGAGCNLGDVDRLTQEHGLATTLGFVSETGIAGLTLGGGFGYLTRQFGYTVDDLLEVSIVTASGEKLRASRDENDDLFWAIRGGGGNFGVVTEFVFRLHEIGPRITGGLIAWSAEKAGEVLDAFRNVTSRSPRELTLALLMRNAPPAPWLSADKHGKPLIAIVVNHTGSAEEARADLAPLREIGDAWADLIQEKPYAAQQSMLDATQPKGMHYYWKSEFIPGLSDEMLATYRAQFVDQTAPSNQIVLFQLEGALSEFDEDDGAVGNRDAAFACVIQSMFPPHSPDAAANREWVRNAWKALKPFSTGGNYINFQTNDEVDDRIAEAYRGNILRLAQVKARYDAENLFRVNRNIVPAEA